MKYVYQFLIIITIAFIGELLHFLIPLPIPASIYGIILLFSSLEFKLIKVKDIYETSLFLIVIMPIMFIPIAVGLIDSWDVVKSAWFKYLIITIVSTFVVMGCSGLITQYILQRKGKRQNQDERPS